VSLFRRRAASGDTTSHFRYAVSLRLIECGGLALVAVALCLAAALWSYNPQDPSFNTANANVTPSNYLGLFGAFIADEFVQWLGLASALPTIIFTCWAWQIIRYHQLASPILRLISAVALIPTVAMTVASLQQLIPLTQVAWPSASGFGGTAGDLLARKLIESGRSLLHGYGATGFFLLAIALCFLLVPLALGLQRHEWRALMITIMRTSRGIASLFRTIGRRGVAHATPDIAGYAPEEPARRGYAAVSPAYNSPSSRTQNAASHHGDGWLHPPDTRREPQISPAQAASQAAPGAPSRTDNPYARQLAQISPQERDAARHHPEILHAEEENSVDPMTTQVEPQKSAPEPHARRGFFSFARPRQAASPAESPSRPAPMDPQLDGWQLPSLNLLKPAPPAANSGPTREVLQANARLLEQVLADYGVQGQIGDIHAGPVVTLYELEPAPGIRSARVIGLADDVARSLSVLSVRIATVPGRNVIGIEVPNAIRETVFLSEVLDTPEFKEPGSHLKLALGKDIAGEPICADLVKMPHLLIAGTTGSGKSVGVNAMILSLLFRHPPEECRLIMIDPKILELSIYEGIPHLLTPVVTEPHKAVAALKWAVREMDRRYRAMGHLQVRNIAGYNHRVRQAHAQGEMPMRRVQTGFDSETGRPVFDEQQLNLETMPFIVIIIDEMADLMMVAGKDIEGAVQRLAQKARAAGIHVIMATQRPSVDVITGTIKANFPTRISFQVISKFDSRTILGEQGAEQLLGQGDMLYMQGAARITRVHGPFVADSEVEAVVADLKSKGEPIYNDEIVAADPDEDLSSAGNGLSGGYDGETTLFDQAVDLVAREGKASTSFIQRHLSIGYNRAAKIIEEMEKQGIVSAANHVGRREVLVRSRRDEG